EFFQNYFSYINKFFKYIKTNKNSIYKKFVARTLDRLNNDLTSFKADSEQFLLNEIKDAVPFLQQYPEFLQLAFKYYEIRQIEKLDNGTHKVRFDRFLKAKHMVLYHSLKALEEILGRKTTIRLYKDFILYNAQTHGEIKKITCTEARKRFVNYWAKCGGFNFAIYDFDEDMWVAKFDKCVWHESMKDVDDQEMANYVVCYPGRINNLYWSEYLIKKTSQTLFQGDICDELYYSRYVHDDPESPSQEFLRKLVVK
ncbi:MAG: hypothetical protein ACFFBD_26985, partial [Candidatus Hodarchaeota archaeon]